MYIKKVELENFRAFDSRVSIELGSGITCIAGLNGTGKSSVLAVLGNCGELKAAEGKHINGSRFRARYADLIRKDRSDTPGFKARLYFGTTEDGESLPLDKDGNPRENLGYRATIQHEERYRLLPLKSEQGHERKLSWPTYYLGLSRLYPVGESDSASPNSIKLSEEQSIQFIKDYKDILSTPDDVKASALIEFSDAKNKIGASVSTERYGDMANSAGQDNLGQILLTTMSFEKLKAERGASYNGGLFLIDEIDSTLHPAAQNKLYIYLTRKAKELNLQIVFTTHSLSLLEFIHKHGSLNSYNKFSRLLYFSRDRGKVEVDVNPPMKAIQARLRVTMNPSIESVKVPLLTEDPVAADFVEWLLAQFYDGIQLRKSQTSMGFDQMSKLIRSYPDLFFDSLIVFDADVKKSKNKKIVDNDLESTNFKEQLNSTFARAKFRKYFFLPGEEAIETMMWDCISALPASDDFYYDSELFQLHATRQTLVIATQTDYEASNPDNKDPLEFHKHWFGLSAVQEIRHNIYGRWLKDNQQEVESWVTEVKDEYEMIGQRLDILFSPAREKKKDTA